MYNIQIKDVDSLGKIIFSFTGPESSETCNVTLFDENTGLIVHKTSFEFRNDYEYWVSTGPSNARRLKNVVLTIEHSTGIYQQAFQMHGESRFVVVNGKPIKLEGDELYPIVCEVFFDKIYELDFVRVSPGDVVLDIGANFGIFSLYCQLFNPKKLISVEPVKSTFLLMQKNLSNYKIEYVNKAVSWKDGTDIFAITSVSGNNYSKKYGNPIHQEWGFIEAINEEVVETVNINTLIKQYQLDRIDFLKVDCEGGEVPLFSTIEPDFLKHKVSKIAVEYHSLNIYELLMQIFQRAGFVIEQTRGEKEIGIIYAYNSNYAA